MVKKVLQKKYIIGWCCLFVKKKKFVMINIFKVKECFYKDVKDFKYVFIL